jgi:hypothetical protein
MYEVIIQTDSLNTDTLGIFGYLFRHDTLDPDIGGHTAYVVRACTTPDLGARVMLWAAITTVDSNIPAEMITDLLKPVNEIGINENWAAFAALALEFIQFEVFGQLDTVGSIVGLYHGGVSFLI